MFWRRKLPHWAPEEEILFVTWRLAGTLPQPQSSVLVADPRPGRTFVREDRQVDRAARGPRWLADPGIAASLVEVLLYGESIRRSYDLYAWVVMPNHVHLVMKPLQRLPEVMRWLKAASAVRANRILGRAGQAFWQREYFDHWIKTSKEFASAIAYVENNPVKANLAASPEDWPWSSAAKDTGDKIAGATKTELER